MRCTYILHVEGAGREAVCRILGPSMHHRAGDWALELQVGPDDSPVPFVDTFLGVLEGKYGALHDIGVERDDIAIWLLYEYDEQCNMEFSATDLKRLGDAGITLCVSCWEGPS